MPVPTSLLRSGRRGHCAAPGQLGAGRRGSRGFTLLEMLAVLAVISVLAAVATPGFVEMIRERRTQRDAAAFSEVFRGARARALGRGAAVTVAVLGDPPVAVVYEHISSDASQLPLPGCRSQGTWRIVERLTARPDSTRLVLTHPTTNAPLTDLEVCFTPRGRTYFGVASGGTPALAVDFSDLDATIVDGGTLTGFQSLTSVVSIDVQRVEGATTGLPRRVLVMPNGQARVSL